MMKAQKNKQAKKGVTLIELVVVIAMLLVLATLGTLSVGAYQDWQKGLTAGEQIKSVYQAQRLYLSNYPTKTPADITLANIIKFMPNGATSLPVVTGLDGETLTIDFNTSPPVYKNGGANYDPSTTTTDSLWDAGE